MLGQCKIPMIRQLPSTLCQRQAGVGIKEPAFPMWVAVISARLDSLGRMIWVDTWEYWPNFRRPKNKSNHMVVVSNLEETAVEITDKNQERCSRLSSVERRNYGDYYAEQGRHEECNCVYLWIYFSLHVVFICLGRRKFWTDDQRKFWKCKVKFVVRIWSGNIKKL